MNRKIWFQLHWLIGISAGLVLAVVGVTGAMLSFEPEILHWLNPGLMNVAPSASAMLSPAGLKARANAQLPERRVVAFQMSSDPALAVRIGFVPLPEDARPQAAQGQAAAGPPGRMRIEWRYADPYTGSLRPAREPRGDAFLHTVEDLHRNLTYGPIGKQIVGASTVGFLVLALSGLYLRWPRRPLDWRVWFKFNHAHKGRSLLWHVHAMTGAWLLLFYLLFGLTGLYWSYEWYRNGLLALSGSPKPTREAPALPIPTQGSVDLEKVWQVFERESGAYRTVNLTLPNKPDLAVDIRYLPENPAHDRANNRLILHPVTGEVIRHERYSEKTLGGRLVSSMFPLHSGSFFGWGGRLLMMLSSLLMPLFAVTGWMMYLRRRSLRKVAQANDTASPVSPERLAA